LGYRLIFWLDFVYLFITLLCKYWWIILIRKREILLKQLNTILHKSFSYSNILILIYCFDSSLMEAQMKYKTKAAALEDACFRNRVYTMIPTRVKSKLFTAEVPTLQPSQNNANLMIRPKKIISIMLVFIPVIRGKKRYISCLFVFSPFAQWTQWGTVKIHWLFTHVLVS